MAPAEPAQMSGREAVPNKGPIEWAFAREVFKPECDSVLALVDRKASGRDEPVQVVEQTRPIDVRLATPVHPPGWVHRWDLDPRRADRPLAPEDLANHCPWDLAAMAQGGASQPLDSARRADLAGNASAHRRPVRCHEFGARVLEH